jgi:hypothetical protein
VPLNVPVIAANVDAPVTFKVVPTYNAFAMPTPPAVMIEPVVVLVASVTRLLLMPCANGILAVAVVCPSFVIAVDRPVPRSEVKALKAVEEMTVPVTTGWPAVLMFKVPLPVLYRGVMPFLGLYLCALMLITYIPWLSLGPLALLR